MITVFLKKSKSFITVLKQKLFDFIDWHLFCSSGKIWYIQFSIWKNTKSKKESYKDEK